jgi:hypothetical protein
MSEHNPGGWGAYERLVLTKLEDLSAEIKELRVDINEEVKDIRKEQTKQDVAIAMLQVKSGLWGAVAAVMTVALFVGYQLLGGGGL